MSHDSTINHLSTGTPDTLKHSIGNKFSVASLYFSEDEARCGEVASADEESLIQLCHPPASVSYGVSTSATPTAHNPQSNTTSQGDHTSSSCFYEFPECEEVESNAGGVNKSNSIPSLQPVSSPTLEDEESESNSKVMWNGLHIHANGYSEMNALPDPKRGWLRERLYVANGVCSETTASPSSTSSRDLLEKKRTSSRLHDEDSPSSISHVTIKRRRSRNRKNSSGERRASKRPIAGVNDVSISSSSNLPPITVQLPPTPNSGRLLMRLKRTSQNSECYRVEILPSVASDIDCCSHVSHNSLSECNAGKPERLFVIDSAPPATTPSVDSAPLSIATSTSYEHTQSEDCTRTQDKGMTSCHLPDGRVFTVGDIVWAKISGYPYWPSKIIRITETEVPIPVPSRGRRGRGRGGIHRMSNNSSPASRAGYVREYRCCVDWLAWKQFSYISCDKLFHFEEHFDKKYSPKNTKKYYAQAVKEAQSIVASRISNALSLSMPLATSCPSECSSSTPHQHHINLDTSHCPASADLALYNNLSAPSVNDTIRLSSADLSTMAHPDTHSRPLSMVCSSLFQDSDPAMLTQFWNPLDLPELSGQLFDETPSGIRNALEFSDDEEISYRKAITNLAIKF